MTMENERVDTTSKASSRHSIQSINWPGSPLKREIINSLNCEDADPYDPPPFSPRPRTRDILTYDATHRWTVLAREAEADELSIVSLTSEEKGYYTSLIPDGAAGEVLQHHGESSRTSSRLGSVISGFDENAFVDNDHTPPDLDEEHDKREGSIERFSEIDYEETIQFAPPTQPPPFIQLAPTDPPPYILTVPLN